MIKLRILRGETVLDYPGMPDLITRVLQSRRGREPEEEVRWQKQRPEEMCLLPAGAEDAPAEDAPAEDATALIKESRHF